MKTFEENISRLEELSDKIRNPEIGIEDALETFEEGIKLAKTLEKELEKIEGKIQILMNSPLDEKSYQAEESVTESPENNEYDIEEKSTKSSKAQKNEKKDAVEKKEFNEDDLQLDLFEDISAPTEGLRQNG